jgi:predicted DNA binding protein
MRVLTTRQQEILQVAVEAGYYSNPRGATHEDIANTIGIAPTTVGDHLREIESKVFETLVR